MQMSTLRIENYPNLELFSEKYLQNDSGYDPTGRAWLELWKVGWCVWTITPDQYDSSIYEDQWISLLFIKLKIISVFFCYIFGSGKR